MLTTRLRHALSATVMCLGALGLSGLASVAHAQPAVIYDMGGKFDKSFNQAGFDGEIGRASCRERVWNCV